jgi:nucleoside-diphosphate-sugar epimerase
MRDHASLRSAVQGVDAVVHVAGQMSTIRAGDYWDINTDATAALGCAAADTGVRRFVYLSSLAARGPGDSTRGPITSTPVSAYGQSKREGEHVLNELAHRMSIVHMRAPIVYGERDRGFLIFFRLVKAGLMPLMGDGTRRLSWIHVRDLATAQADAVEADVRSGSVYTPSDGAVHTWRSLALGLKTALGRRHSLMVPVPISLYAAAGFGCDFVGRRFGRPMLLSAEKALEARQLAWVSDNRSITADLGWETRIDTATGLRDTVAWYGEHRWV